MPALNPSKWLKILTSAPRLEKEEWARMDIVSKWLIAVRGRFLIMTLISCAIGGLLALSVRKFQPSFWLLCTVGFLLAHATGNILNDLVDYILGVDRGDYLRLYDEPHPLEHKLMSIREHLIYTIFTGVIALAIGLYLVYVRGFLALLLLLISVFLCLFYTYPLKHIGLGEPTLFIIWGPLMVGGSYFIASGEWDWQVVLASIPHALGVLSVLLGDHIDKYEYDKAKRIRTLPVLLGERWARILTIIVMLCQYLSVLFLVIAGIFSPVMVLVFIVFPSFLRVMKLFQSPMPKEKPKEKVDFGVDVWPRWFRAGAFWHMRRFSIAFLFLLAMGVVVSKFVVFSL